MFESSELESPSLSLASLSAEPSAESADKADTMAPVARGDTCPAGNDSLLGSEPLDQSSLTALAPNDHPLNPHHHQRQHQHHMPRTRDQSQPLKSNQNHAQKQRNVPVPQSKTPKQRVLTREAVAAGVRAGTGKRVEVEEEMSIFSSINNIAASFDLTMSGILGTDNATSPSTPESASGARGGQAGSVTMMTTPPPRSTHRHTGSGRGQGQPMRELDSRTTRTTRDRNRRTESIGPHRAVGSRDHVDGRSTKRPQREVKTKVAELSATETIMSFFS